MPVQVEGYSSENAGHVSPGLASSFPSLPIPVASVGGGGRHDKNNGPKFSGPKKKHLQKSQIVTTFLKNQDNESSALPEIQIKSNAFFMYKTI